MDAASTVEVVGAEGGAGNSGGGGGAGGDMVASVTSIMENSKDAMAELFQDEAEVDDIIWTESYLFIYKEAGGQDGGGDPSHSGYAQQV